MKKVLKKCIFGCVFFLGILFMVCWDSKLMVKFVISSFNYVFVFRVVMFFLVVLSVFWLMNELFVKICVDGVCNVFWIVLSWVVVSGLRNFLVVFSRFRRFLCFLVSTFRCESCFFNLFEVDVESIWFNFFCLIFNVFCILWIVVVCFVESDFVGAVVASRRLARFFFKVVFCECLVSVLFLWDVINVL